MSVDFENVKSRCFVGLHVPFIFLSCRFSRPRAVNLLIDLHFTASRDNILLANVLSPTRKDYTNMDALIAINSAGSLSGQAQSSHPSNKHHSLS